MPQLSQRRPKPLDAYPLIRTRDIDELRAGIAQLFVDSKFTINGDHRAVHGWMNYRHIRHTGLLFGSYGAAIQARFGVMNFFVQGIPIRGVGEQLTNGTELPVGRTTAGVLTPGATHGVNFGAGFEHLALKIDQAALMTKLAVLTGAPTGDALNVVAATDFSQPAAMSLRRLVAFFASELSEPSSPMPTVALVEAEQAMMVWFLCGNRHNYSHLLEQQPRSPTPWQVRRAEEYIEANWDQPISVEALTVVTGASARSLFHFFRQSRGYSPMAWVKHVRLERARQMLASPTAETSVTDVACACGFGNLGHFAKDYREKFGELPSGTLNRAKGINSTDH